MKRHQTWCDVDSKMWGDTRTMQLDLAVGAVPPASLIFTGGQLVQAAVPNPVMWQVVFNSEGSTIPAGQVTDITLLFRLVIGCGKAKTTIRVPLVLPVASGFVPAPGLLAVQIPAENLQIDCQITGLAGPVGPASYIFSVSAMAAPLGRWDELIERGRGA